MRSKFVILILISGILLSFCYRCHVAKNLEGHWVSEKSFADLDPGDTIELIKRKFKNKLYQFGSGIASGCTFSRDGNFSEYNNTLCSTETNPVQYADEHWSCKMFDTLIISGPQRIIRYQILQPPLRIGKKLSLKILAIDFKKAE